jgi:hypothetical protein
MSAETTTTHEASESLVAHEAILAALEETRSELAKARADLQSTVRTLAIDRALADAGAMSIAAARARLGESAEGEPAAAVAALKAREPALFAPRPRIVPGVSTSSPRECDAAATGPVRTAANRAAAGDRRALLDYMRLRRVRA